MLELLRVCQNDSGPTQLALFSFSNQQLRMQTNNPRQKPSAD